MELDEAAQRWLVVLALALGVALVWALGRLRETRRRSWFEGLASTFSSRVEHGPGMASRFDAEVGGRQVEVIHRYFGRGTSEGPSVGWRLVSTVPLQHVSDIYSMRLRSDPAVPGGVSVDSHGYRPAENWMSEYVRRVIADFYGHASAREPLEVEGGRLVYRSPVRMDGGALRELASRQVAVADALESALG